MNFEINDKMLSELSDFRESLISATFDEKSISNFLINARSLITDNSLVKEFANFYAHREYRNQGICYEYIDVLYTKLKYIHFRGDSSIDFNKIPHQLFNVLFILAVKKFDESTLFQQCKINKFRLQYLINKCYRKSGKFFIAHSRLLTQKERVDLESGLNCVLSMAHFQCIATVDAVIKSFIGVFKKIPLFKDEIKTIEDLLWVNKDDIFICLLCLMHSAKIKLYDSSEAKCYLAIHPEVLPTPVENPNMKLAICCDFKINANKVSTTLLISEKNTDDYFEYAIEKSHMPQKLKIFNAKRINNKLKITF